MRTSELLTSPFLFSAEALISEACRIMAPPPKLTLSQWADAKRKLGSKTNAEPGDWRTDRVPYLREIMDCVTDPLVSEVTWMAAAQVAKTEGLINNGVGYYMDQDPSPIGVTLENEDKQKAWSIERLSPMLTDTPCLNDLVSRKGGPDSLNRLDFKEYPGGFLAILCAGSEGDLSSRPLRILFNDEIDKWKMLKAGDPMALIEKRTSTFFNRKIVCTSTPRDRETSRILRKYEASDKRVFHVPCPFCKHEQELREGQLKFDRPGNSGDVVEKVWYECEACREKISHIHKRRMLAQGRWIAEKPFNGHAGFRISALYSPWVTWKEYAEAFLRMKRQVDTFKTFVNEWRGEPWDEQMASDKDVSAYTARCESYETVPGPAVMLTCSVDIQADRIEAEVKAWDADRQSWGLEFKIFHGKPHLLTDSKKLPEVWQQLDAFLSQTWVHEYGSVMSIDFTLIDQGFLLDEVQKFCKPRQGRNIRPCRGMSNTAHELIGRANKNNRMRVKYFPIGTNRAKEIIFSNADLTEPGPGYMHWNKKFDAEYFKQLLTSERHKWVKGVKVYEKISSAARNEALDLNVYNLAAFELARPLIPIRQAQIAEAKKQWEKDQGKEAGEGKEAIVVQEQKRTGRRIISRGVE